MKKDAHKSSNAAKLRRRTELELLKFKTAVEQTVEGFAIADLNGHIQFVNAAWAKMHGYTVKELIGKHLGIFHTEEQLRKEVIPFNKKAMKNGAYEGEVGHRRRDGTTFPTLMTSTVIKDENRNFIALAGMAHDITERKRAEEALRVSQIHLNEAQRLAKVGSWSWIVKTDIVTWSDELYAINHRDPKLPAIQYSEQPQLYTPGSWALLDKAVRHTLVTGEPYALELEIIRKDGTHYWGFARGEAIRDDAGRVIRLHGTVQDITERKRTEEAEALRASMQFAQATLDALTTYICVLDRNGAIITTNAAWRELVASNQARPQTVTKGAYYLAVCAGVIGPESGEVEKFADGLRQVLEGRSDLFAMEYPRHSPVGQHWFLGRVTRFIANGHAHIVVTHENITERKQAELSLKASEQKARAIFDQTFQFIGLMTTDGTLIEANRSALEFGGIEASSVLGKFFWETSWWTHSPELQEKVRQAVKKAAQGEFIRFEATHTAKDRTLHYIDFSLKPVKDETGKVIFLIPEGRDITERKQAEDKVRKLHESLERRVQERTAELACANQELETLIRIASHDLRSPLVNIQGFNQILNKACNAISRILADTALPDETRQALVASHEKAQKSMRFINAGVEKMNGLISGLLRLSQLGRAPLALQPLDMNALLQAVVEAMEFQIRTAAAKVTVDALPDCRADAALISQVFSNLLDNAIKYRDSARLLRVRIWGRREDARTVYCVEDNGLGVAPEHQQKIWDLFYRLGPQGSGAGEGIGLPAVQRILARHGGMVWMESEIGKGSRFFLALPAAAKETEP